MICDHGYINEECHLCDFDPYLYDQHLMEMDEVDWEPDREESSDGYDYEFWDMIDENYNYESLVAAELSDDESDLDS
jgi:hypothetical protein